MKQTYDDLARTIDQFRYCPRCGQLLPPRTHPYAIKCDGCGLLLFLNPASAVGAFLERESGEVLFLRRAREPGAGRLGLPGGFVDPGETVEAALQRELREEIGLETLTARFLCSQPNDYDYRGVQYAVVDLFFVVHSAEPARIIEAEEVAELVWRLPSAVHPEEIAFKSVRAAFVQYQADRALRSGPAVGTG